MDGEKVDVRYLVGISIYLMLLSFKTCHGNKICLLSLDMMPRVFTGRRKGLVVLPFPASGL